jgi:hypothetical protein
MTCEEINEIYSKATKSGISSLNELEIKKLLVLSVKSHNIFCDCDEDLDLEKVYYLGN